MKKVVKDRIVYRDCHYNNREGWREFIIKTDDGWVVHFMITTMYDNGKRVYYVDVSYDTIFAIYIYFPPCGNFKTSS